jgi:hypothetical protein
MRPFDLSGWDAIAKHLGIDNRTARRWEVENKLPVLRVRGRIRANTEEIDHWVRQQANLTNPNNDDDRPSDFRRVFGTDAMMYLIYSELTLNNLVPKIIEAYEHLRKECRSTSEVVGGHRLREILKAKPLVTYDPKGKHGKDGYNFRAEHSACVCEVRAAAYVAAEFSQYRSLNWKVVGNAHGEVHGKADLSFVSFGTLINSKSQELLRDPQALVGFREGRFVSNRRQLLNVRSDGRLRFLHEPVDDSSEYDYGVIARIHPMGSTVSEQRVWIACAGVQQRGTSAAAWVLAHWKGIAGGMKQNTGRFVGLVRVPRDDDKGDDSATLVWVAETPEELEAHESTS